MVRKHRRGKRLLFIGRPQRATGLSDSNFFYSEYRPLTIIAPILRPQRSAPLIIVGALIVLGAALIFAFAQ